MSKRLMQSNQLWYNEFMQNIKSLTFYKNPQFILVLILAVFFLKGVIFASIFPIFGGQDESRHYNTVQYLAEPADKNWELNHSTVARDKDHIETHGFSEEIGKTAVATDTDVLRGDIFNTINFSNNSDGLNEKDITAMQWDLHNYDTAPEIVGGSIYHTIASWIERALSGQNILVRFYTLRIFSVLLGTLAIFFFYLTAKTIGISSKHSLLLTAIISFQPKLAMYLSNINYDVLLIPLFFLFTLAGVLILKKGLNWKNGLLLVASTILAIQTKLTGYIILVPLACLLAYILFEKVRTKNKQVRYFSYGLSVVAFIALAIILKGHLSTGENSISEMITSISNYLSKSLTIGRFGLSSRTYWGTLDWTNNWFMGSITNFIWFIEAFAIIGLGILFFSKKPHPDFLPAKKYIIFLICMIIALQLGIRTADWSIYNETGSLDLGTPGRYFLPNLASHIILMFTGLGALFAYFKKEKYFDYSLLAGLILMSAFSMYLIFDVIILRFYL